MIINYKKPIVFAVFYALIKIIFIIIFHLSLRVTQLGLQVFFVSSYLLIFSLLYSLYFKVKFTEKFNKLSSIYVTAIAFIEFLLAAVLSWMANKPSALMNAWQQISNTLPVVIAVIVLASLYIIGAVIIFIVNYFLIFFGNKLALSLLKNKKVTEI